MNKQLFIGDKPEQEKMLLVKNDNWVKAKGGLWTSTYNNGKSEWLEWCESEDFYTSENLDGWILTVKDDAHVLEIDNLSDLKIAYSKYGLEKTSIVSILDFEKISEDYDGVRLTSNGQIETRLSHPYSLYGWDCESTHWFRWVFDNVEYLKNYKYEMERGIC